MVPLTPDSLPYNEELRPENVAPTRLMELASLAVRDASSVQVEAKWKTGEVATSDDPRDLDDITEPGQLVDLRVVSTFSDRTILVASLIGWRPRVHAARGEAAERARQIVARWNALPRERLRNNTIRATVYWFFMLSMGAIIAVTFLKNSDQSGSFSWGTAILFALATVMMIVAFTLWVEGLVSIGEKAIVAERQERWWLDLRAVVPVIVGIAGLVVSVVSLIKK